MATLSQPFWLHCNGCGALPSVVECAVGCLSSPSSECPSSGKPSPTSTDSLTDSSKRSSEGTSGSATTSKSTSVVSSLANQNSAKVSHEFLFASCGHTFCKKCAQICESKKLCSLCNRSPFAARLIDSTLPPNVAKVFMAPEKIFEEGLKVVKKAAEFQRNQEKILKERATVMMSCSEAERKKMLSEARKEILRKAHSVLGSGATAQKLGGADAAASTKVDAARRDSVSQQKSLFPTSVSLITPRVGTINSGNKQSSEGLKDSAQQHQPPKKPGFVNATIQSKASSSTCSITTLGSTDPTRGSMEKKSSQSGSFSSKARPEEVVRPHSSVVQKPKTSVPDTTAHKNLLATSSASVSRMNKKEQTRKWVASLKSPPSTAKDTLKSTI